MENAKNRANILIFTQDHDLAKSLTLLLQEQYKVFSTGNLAKARGIVERREVDLFIADFGLASDCGLEILEKIRLRNRETPIIAFCPYHLKNAKTEQQVRERVDLLLHMPVSVEEILPAIARLLNVPDQTVHALPTPNR